MASSRDDHAAIIVATVGDNGRITRVWRYRARESTIVEALILALLDAGRHVQVTFIDRVDGDGLDAKVQRQLERLVR
jgi:hypothetical protein